MVTTRTLDIIPISLWKPASKQQAEKVLGLHATHIMFRPDEKRGLPLWVEKALAEKGLTAVKIGYTTYHSNTYALVPVHHSHTVGQFGSEDEEKEEDEWKPRNGKRRAIPGTMGLVPVDYRRFKKEGKYWENPTVKSQLLRKLRGKIYGNNSNR